MFEKQKEFARKHIILTATNHAAGGFGLALILQSYFAGDPFLPVWLGWVLFSYAVVVHFIEWTR